MVAAFVGGGYEAGKRPVAAVPEPNAATLVFVAAIALPVFRRSREQGD